MGIGIGMGMGSSLDPPAQSVYGRARAGGARRERTMGKQIYFFGAGAAEGDATMKELLGGKGAGLAEMSRLGIPVPPGFTLTTEVCHAFYTAGSALPDALKDEVRATLGRVGEIVGAR